MSFSVTGISDFVLIGGFWVMIQGEDNNIPDPLDGEETPRNVSLRREVKGNRTTSVFVCKSLTACLAAIKLRSTGRPCHE
jgi:hypothetical protein